MVRHSSPSREDYYRVLADCLPKETLVVTALSNSSYLWAKIRDEPENFYFEDAMGLTLPFALGLAVAQSDRQVVVIEGDGAMVMHLGALVTVGAVAPKNLTILIIQNGLYAASGGQELTNADLDFCDLGRATGLEHSENVNSADTFRSALVAALERDAPSLLAMKTEPDLEDVIPPFGYDAIRTKDRFAEAIGAPRYVPTSFGGGRLVTS